MTKKTLYAFTSAACNYLPKAQLLCDSLRRFHPEFRLVLALPDRLPENADPCDLGWDEVLPVESLGIRDWKTWTFTHTIVELATAIKPVALESLLSRPDCSAVLYFDPDMVLFSRLDDLVERLNATDILLTPHQTRPESGLAEVMDNEISSLKHGAYNLGFIGVRPTPNGRQFARWWAERTYYFCQDDIPNGLFTDQRWIDLAPALFGGVDILRSSRFNVAPWNLTTRRLAGSAGQGYTVDGAPLGFYHFTGFDSGAHHVMTGKYGSDNSAVAELVSWYQKTTASLADAPLSTLPWAYGHYADSRPIPRAHRLIYRCRHDLQLRYPDPFQAGGANASTFAGWCEMAGKLEYPELLTANPSETDLRGFPGYLTPSVAPPPGELPGVAARLKAALGNPRVARALVRQTARVVRREGIGGLIARLRRLGGGR